MRQHKQEQCNSTLQRGFHYFGDLRDKLEDYLIENFTKVEIDDKCAKIKVPAAGVNTIEEAINQEQIKVRNMNVTYEDQRVGEITTVGKVIKFHDEAKEVFTTAPLLGQHNDEIYSELMTPEELQKLKEEKII